jgi:heme-degrading monooxygenase HmoA
MVRVMIERWLRSGREEHFQAEMRQLRREAVHYDGYITGETLRDRDDHLHWVVLSTWQSFGDWDAWAVSQQREEKLERIAPLLAKPARITILEPA